MEEIRTNNPKLIFGNIKSIKNGFMFDDTYFQTFDEAINYKMKFGKPKQIYFKTPDGSIKITKGKYEILFDAEDFKLVDQYLWHDCNGYAINSENIRMHNLIMNHKPGEMICDHINQNRSDNRRANLRIVTHSVNSINKKTKQTSTNTRGIRDIVKLNSFKFEWKDDSGFRNSKSFNYKSKNKQTIFEQAINFRDTVYKNSVRYSIGLSIKLDNE